jgi:hypothetical protein
MAGLSLCTAFIAQDNPAVSSAAFRSQGDGTVRRYRFPLLDRLNAEMLQKILEEHRALSNHLQAW